MMRCIKFICFAFALMIPYHALKAQVQSGNYWAAGYSSYTYRVPVNVNAGSSQITISLHSNVGFTGSPIVESNSVIESFTVNGSNISITTIPGFTGTFTLTFTVYADGAALAQYYKNNCTCMSWASAWCWVSGTASSTTIYLMKSIIVGVDQ
jgi:hypothetical protein